MSKSVMMSRPELSLKKNVYGARGQMVVQPPAEECRFPCFVDDTPLFSAVEDVILVRPDQMTPSLLKQKPGEGRYS